MSLTQMDTENLVTAVVKALDPKFTALSLEIGDFQITTKQDITALKDEVKKTNERLEELEENFNNFSGSMVAFESKVVTAFTHVEDQFKAQAKLIKQGFDHEGKLSTKFQDHEIRIVKLERVASNS